MSIWDFNRDTEKKLDGITENIIITQAKNDSYIWNNWMFSVAFTNLIYVPAKVNNMFNKSKYYIIMYIKMEYSIMQFY